MIGFWSVYMDAIKDWKSCNYNIILDLKNKDKLLICKKNFILI